MSVCLAAKADGTKLKPMIVFKGAKCEVAALHQEFKSQAYIASSTNAWMNTELTNQWVNYVLGSFSFNRRILIRDSYECHMEYNVMKSLNAKKVDTDLSALLSRGAWRRLNYIEIVYDALSSGINEP